MESSSESIAETRDFSLPVGPDDSGQRLDLFLARQQDFTAMTRSMIQNLIRSGLVSVNGGQRKTGYHVQSGDVVRVIIPPPAPSELIPEQVPFRIIHEDADLLVLSKPPGVVVHPACGHSSGTLVHGLLFHCDELPVIGGEQRPGIVHRLDKDTSGVMVVAKNDQAHHFLVDQFKERKVKKIYHAILDGRPANRQGRIELPIGRHPVNRKKMAVRERGGREAITNWKMLEEFALNLTYVELRLETGRTHQIRVHMAANGCPVLGDALYGKRKPPHPGVQGKRQCLHASMLSFVHPGTGKLVSFVAPLWPDFVEMLESLRNWRE